MRTNPAIAALATIAAVMCMGTGAANPGPTRAAAPSSRGPGYTLLAAKSWVGSADADLVGPASIFGDAKGVTLHDNSLSAHLHIVFHFDKLHEHDKYHSEWSGTAAWSGSFRSHQVWHGDGKVLKDARSEGSGSKTVHAAFIVYFSKQMDDRPSRHGCWSLVFPAGDDELPIYRLHGSVSSVDGESGPINGPQDAPGAQAISDLEGDLPPDGVIHGTRHSQAAWYGMPTIEARPRCHDPSDESDADTAEDVRIKQVMNRAAKASQQETNAKLPRLVVRWNFAPNPCSGEAHTVFLDTPVALGLDKDRVLLDGKSDAGHPPLTARFKGSVDVQPDSYWRFAEDAKWAAYATSGMKTRLEPATGMRCAGIGDCNVQISYYGMPLQNSTFGPHDTSVSIPALASCVQPRKMELTYFYSRDGTDNPEGKGQSKPPIPNWFHYWSETSAVQSFSPLQIMYDASNGHCFEKNAVDAGYFVLDPDEADDVHLCDGLVQGSWLNPVTGRRTTGIDVYATTLLHEFAHKRHYHEWWLALDREIEHASGKRKAALRAKKAEMDKDHDHIPDRLECRWRKDGTAYCPRWRGKWAPRAGVTDSCNIDDYDEHCLIYRYDQPKWRVGSADKEDWSCPGKQSGNLCRRDAKPDAAASAPAGTNGASSTEKRRVERVAAGFPRPPADTGSDGAKSSPRRDDPPASHPANSGAAAPAPMSAAHAVSLLENADPLVQVRGLNALSRSGRIKPTRKLHLMLPALRHAIAARGGEKFRISTGFLPQQDWLRLQYLKHVSALGSKALPALRLARSKATGPYREYLTLALAAAGGKHPVRLLSPLVSKGSTWAIRRRAVLLIGTRAGSRSRVQKLLKATLQDPANTHWRSDVVGPSGATRHLYPVRDAAALMLVRAGYNIKRTADGGYAAVWTPAVPRLAALSQTAPAASSAKEPEQADLPPHTHTRHEGKRAAATPRGERS